MSIFKSTLGLIVTVDKWAPLVAPASIIERLRSISSDLITSAVLKSVTEILIETNPLLINIKLSHVSPAEAIFLPFSYLFSYNEYISSFINISLNPSKYGTLEKAFMTNDSHGSS